MRPVLIVGGAPRLPVDAVRHLTVRATGTTAVRLRDLLGDRVPVLLLLAVDAAPGAEAMRYTTRGDLDAALRAWITANPDGVVVMSAAVNDYTVTRVERVVDGTSERVEPGAKIASRADEIVIRLGPTPKLIDQLAAWGHRGPLVGFKFEEAATVLDAAERLRGRTGAQLVVANSLDGTLQALVDAEGVHRQADRESLLAALATRLAALATD